MIELLNCDCMEYMVGLPDKAFDLAIVDPPYGINKAGPIGGRCFAQVTNHEKKNWDKYPPEILYFDELKRVSKNQIIWGANHFVNRIAEDSPCWIVWDKLNTGDFADCELAYTSFKTAVRKFSYKWSGMMQGDMKNKESRIHPTQKPIKLYQWLLENYAKPGQRILDTHLGSGSSAIAAHYFGVDFVGCELDKDYYDAACKRFDQQTRQTTLFDMEMTA